MLIAWTKILARAFTKPGFVNALVVVCSWLLTRRTHAITQSLVEFGIQGRVHHGRLHRLFARGSWSVDELGRLRIDRTAEHFGADDVLPLVVDDTLVPHKGPQIFGLGNHADPVRSSRAWKAFSLGHVWVVVSAFVCTALSRPSNEVNRPSRPRPSSPTKCSI